MMPQIEIDASSGFCFGVVNAIAKAEEELKRQPTCRLYCLGDIVHNSMEVERLRRAGMQTITHDELSRLHDVRVLLRAHGEPPATYATAARRGITLIDATCPVVLRLQQRIKHDYDEAQRQGKALQIVIYGGRGHAEVNGLVGQTNGTAIVIEDLGGLDALDFGTDIALYSQTTKSLEGFTAIISEIRRRMREGARFTYADTICRQVAHRGEHLRDFARAHDVVIFVAGAKSSNGRVLYGHCREANERSYLVAESADVRPEMTAGAASIGICGATSTPRWLMEDIARDIREYYANTVSKQ
jgi:4-hydroxy-3-methylbut-2-enyl diphosphate reductase